MHELVALTQFFCNDRTERISLLDVCTPVGLVIVSIIDLDLTQIKDPSQICCAFVNTAKITGAKKLSAK